MISRKMTTIRFCSKDPVTYLDLEGLTVPGEPSLEEQYTFKIVKSMIIDVNPTEDYVFPERIKEEDRFIEVIQIPCNIRRKEITSQQIYDYLHNERSYPMRYKCIDSRFYNYKHIIEDTKEYVENYYNHDKLKMKYYKQRNKM